MRSERALKQFIKLEEDSTIQNYIAQANSRYILYTAREPHENFPNYTKKT